MQSAPAPTETSICAKAGWGPGLALTQPGLATTTPSVSQNPSPNSWPRSAQWAAAVLLGMVLILLAYHALANSGHATRATQLVTADGPIYRLDLNRAPAAELMQIPGIGPALAERIVARRRAVGPFRTVADLRTVAGIGDKTLASIRPWVCVANDDTDPIPKAAPLPARSRSPGVKKEAVLAGKSININQADSSELQRLPRIGPKLAARIIEERDKRLFQSVNDLRRVKGIGPKTLELVRPFITTGDAP